MVPVPVSGGLHLKSVCSLAGPELLVYFGGALDLAPFAAEGLACLEVREPAGANVLALGGTVLVSSDAPRTAELGSRAKRYERQGVIRRDDFHRAELGRDGEARCDRLGRRHLELWRFEVGLKGADDASDRNAARTVGGSGFSEPPALRPW